MKIENIHIIKNVTNQMEAKLKVSGTWGILQRIIKFGLTHLTNYLEIF